LDKGNEGGRSISIARSSFLLSSDAGETERHLSLTGVESALAERETKKEVVFKKNLRAQAISCL